MSKVVGLFCLILFFIVSCDHKTVTYYDNGNIESEGRMVNNLKEGVWVYYDNNGDTLEVNTYRKNQLNGRSFYFFNNKRRGLETYTNGKKYGDYILYHSNGQIDGKGTLIDGVQQGGWVVYDEKGNLKGEYVLKDGKPDGKFSNYYRNGQKEYVGEYRGDTLEAQYYDSLGNIIYHLISFKGEVIDSLYTP